MHMNPARRGALVLAAVGIALGTAAFASGASATTTVASSTCGYNRCHAAEGGPDRA